MINLADINQGCIVCKKEGEYTRACVGFLEDKNKTHCAFHKVKNNVNLHDMNN